MDGGRSKEEKFREDYRKGESGERNWFYGIGGIRNDEGWYSKFRKVGMGRLWRL